MSNVHTVTVSILDKDYQVACPSEQAAELIVSASHLDKQMRSIRENSKVIGLERIAIMAALNISHELFKASEQNETNEVENEEVTTSAVGSLCRKIDEALYSIR